MTNVEVKDVADRVRALLARRDMSVEGLAAIVDDDPANIVRFLAAERRPTSLQLASIAEALETTVVELVTGEGAPDLVRGVAARMNAPTDAVATALERLTELADLAQLLDTLGHGAPRYRLDELSSARRPYEQGAASARTVRARLGFDEREPLPTELGTLMTMIERQLSIDIAVEPLPQGIDGLSATQGTSRFILMNSRAPATRVRWTLAHELGHLEMGDCEGIRVDESVLGAHTPAETRANGFAAEFLAPSALLAAEVGSRPFDERSVGQLLSTLRISPDALANRLHNSRLVAVGERDRIKAMSGSRELSRLTSRLPDLDSKNDRRIPKRLAQGLLDSFFDGEIGVQPLAILLDVGVDELLREFGSDEGYDQVGGWGSATA